MGPKGIPGSLASTAPLRRLYIVSLLEKAGVEEFNSGRFHRSCLFTAYQTYSLAWISNKKLACIVFVFFSDSGLSLGSDFVSVEDESHSSNDQGKHLKVTLLSHILFKLSPVQNP
jgi:hypothetical protein